MVSLFSTLVLAFAAVASAIQVTTPAVGALVDLSKDVNVAWTTVSTDPTSFSLFLVNNVRYPPSSVKIADGVSTSARNYTIKGGSISATSGSGYQISVQNVTPGQLGTLALSGQFNITGAAASGSGTVTSSARPSSSALSNSTITTSARVTSSAAANGTSVRVTGTPSATTSALPRFTGAANSQYASGFASFSLMGVIAALFI